MKKLRLFTGKPNAYLFVLLFLSLAFHYFSYEHYRKTSDEVVNGGYVSDVFYGPILDSSHKVIEVNFMNNKLHGNIFIKEKGYKTFSQFKITGVLSNFKDGVFQLKAQVLKEQGVKIFDVEHSSHYRKFDVIDDSDLVKRSIALVYRTGPVMILWDSTLQAYDVFIKE
ncbi:hypothetical protein M9194_09305 [Vibrio sp. S4M6]|uniref:hypothetical protein n=1 Tax=Vibrio sinus TaxID=2946865 RepID=UPI002029C6AF|nr:hypothetical protein [Vibrio sinus]MCL9781621.1 hypothetical protein [Vibrio sinus]